jgi:ATP-dependent Clp protease ATP-binding subunit ClpX
VALMAGKKGNGENKQLIEGPVCSFCKEPADPSKGRVLIKGSGDVYICTECAQECLDVAEEYAPKSMEKINSILSSDFKPSQIAAHLDEYVVGQTKAKKILSVAVYNHYKMLAHREFKKNSQVEIEKSNVLLLGPTGSGKTFLLRILSDFLDVPFATQDCTNLTAAGYVGEDVENCVRKLIENADYDIEKAQRGIIYLDEFDKLSRKSENMSITRDVSGEAVQQALLKMMEGSVVEVPPKGGRKHPTGEVWKIDTTNILFVCGGSFEGIEKIIEKRQKVGAQVGFGADVKPKNSKSLNELFMDVKVEDLKKFGMLPEVLGRLPIICPLEELDRDSLLEILTKPKNALIKQYKELMAMDEMEIEFEDEALLAIADLAIKRKTGARSLRSILEETLLDYMYSLPEEKDVQKVIVTKECVTDGAAPTIIKSEAV